MRNATLRRLVGFCLIVIGLGAAHAQLVPSNTKTTLIAGPIRVGMDQGRVECALVNVGSETLSLTTDAVYGDGSIGISYTETVSPGEAASGSWFGILSTSNRPVYCRFTFDGKANQVRAAAIIREYNAPFNTQVILKAD